MTESFRKFRENQGGYKNKARTEQLYPEKASEIIHSRDWA